MTRNDATSALPPWDFGKGQRKPDLDLDLIERMSKEGELCAPDTVLELVKQLKELKSGQ